MQDIVAFVLQDYIVFLAENSSGGARSTIGLALSSGPTLSVEAPDARMRYSGEMGCKAK